MKSASYVTEDRGTEMLVLSRSVGEELVIGDAIRITLLAVKGGRARYGITAPRDVPVDRSEVRDSKNITKPHERNRRSAA